MTFLTVRNPEPAASPSARTGRRATRLWLVAHVVVALSLATVAHAGPYTVTLFERPGAAFTSLFDVNNHGQMVGWSTGAGPLAGADAFIFAGGLFEPLAGPAGAISTNALGISDEGTVVGSYNVDLVDDGMGGMTFGASTAFIYRSGVYTSLAAPGATNTFARHVSPDGRYVSGFYTSDLDIGQGFIYDTTSDMFTLVGAGGFDALTILQGINSSYVVVGSDIILGSPVSRPGIVYDVATGTRTDVLLPGVRRTAFRDIADDGVISGFYVDLAGIAHGFTGYPGAFETVDVAGFNTFVEGSNNAGVLVGNYNGAGVDGAFVASAVPESGALALFACSLAAVPLFRRRRRTTEVTEAS